eukprot:Skav203332  [mRNA]  locus=scaffold284:378378:381578:- [translate_table: standard]
MAVRCAVQLFRKVSELHSLQDPLSTVWEEHSLGSGPDFLFCMKPGATARNFALVAPEFISGKDGHIDLLVTNHEMQNGSVFAYTFSSDDLETAEIYRHTLATGFTPVKVKKGKASPGAKLPLLVGARSPGAPAELPRRCRCLSAQGIFMLTPSSQSAVDWSYDTVKLADLGADIGRPSIGDTDLDGLADIFVPLYDAKKAAGGSIPAGPWWTPGGTMIQLHGELHRGGLSDPPSPELRRWLTTPSQMWMRCVWPHLPERF